MEIACESPSCGGVALRVIPGMSGRNCCRSFRGISCMRPRTLQLAPPCANSSPSIYVFRSSDCRRRKPLTSRCSGRLQALQFTPQLVRMIAPSMPGSAADFDVSQLCVCQGLPETLSFTSQFLGLCVHTATARRLQARQRLQQLTAR